MKSPRYDIAIIGFAICFVFAVFSATFGQNGSNPTGGGGGAATCGSVSNGICYNNAGAFASHANLTFTSNGIITLGSAGIVLNGNNGQNDLRGGPSSFVYTGNSTTSIGFCASCNSDATNQQGMSLSSFATIIWGPTAAQGANADTGLARNAAGDVECNQGATLANSGVPCKALIAGPHADQSTSYQTPSTGFSITIANAVGTLVLDPAGTLATGTIVMQAAPVDGQIQRIKSTQTITSLTLSPNSGQSLKGTLTTLAAGNYIDCQYRNSNTTWYC